MPIERTNSFHLMLSDDEASLLRMLAEREGLNASDYLRSLLRREAGGGSVANVSRIRQIVHLLGYDPATLAEAWSGQKALAGAAPKRRRAPAKASKRR
jgi:hypothetical protein